jgi:2-dehydropantoate 2-reductase
MEDAEHLVQELMHEVVEAARTCGKQLGEEVIERMLDNTRKMVPYKSSMQLDFEHGHPLELEAIFGAIISAVAKAQHRLPRIEMLYQQLQFLQCRGPSRRVA